MSACILPTIRGGSTCWNGARPRRMRSPSTSTGTSCLIARAAACCCRSSARPTAQALENGEIELRYDADEGSFSAWYFEHRLPIAPERYGEILRTDRQGSRRRGRRRPAKRILALASRYRGLRHPNRKEAPGLQGGAAGDRRQRARSSRAGSPPIAPDRTVPRRRWRCIICWNASTTSSAIGGWPPATSTIAASSTSIRWRDCGSRTPALSTPPIGWCSG